MRLRHLLFLLLLAVFIFDDLHAQTYQPISLTGYNHDAIAEGGPSSLATTSREMDAVASNKVMYSEAFRVFAGISGGGLPDSRIITMGSTTFQLENYNANNALFVFRGETRSLDVVIPERYNRLRILCFATEANTIGGATLNVSLSFTDGTTVPYVASYGLSDWFNGTTNVVLQGFGRCSRVAAAPWNADGLPTNPRMYYVDINLSCPDAAKFLQRINFNNATTAGANAPFPNIVIMGVSGVTPLINVVASSVNSDCSGPNGSITLTVTGSGAPYTFNWLTSPPQTGPTATGLSPGVNYTCNITDANGCPAWVFIGSVALNNNAVITAAASSNPICAGSSTQLTANVTTGILPNITWSPGALSGASVTVTPATTTTYTVTGTNTLGCTASAQVTVTVNQLPATPTVMTTPVCPGGNTTLTVTSAVPGEVYNWYDVATGGTPLATGTTYTLTNVTAPATYYVEAVNSASGCIAVARTAVTVTLLAVPSAPVVNNVIVCSGTSATLQVQSPQAGFTYQWYDVATGGTPLASGVSFTVPNVTAPVTYYAEAVSAGGCTSATRTAVTVSILTQLAQPVVTMTNASFTSLTFSWNAVPNALSYEVSTNGGGSWTVPSTGPTGTSHTISGLLGNTTITLSVRALRNQPCETSNPGVATGNTLSSKEIFVPNVFTPNGDGKNDILKVYGNYVASIQFRVFNQWGQVVFISDNINNGWNGAVNGQQQPVGVYAYTLKVTLQDGTIINKKGSVNLIR
ncbi:MAG: gliding motility-associated C-terminal domain-containing protein [Chitinophagaceae bacterium]|nr:gliding motility-associated C-terminal domain-containing protein [Chitinophagaceae bacterium]